MFHKEGFNIIILFFIVITTDVILLEVLFDDSSYLKLILQIFSLFYFYLYSGFLEIPKEIF